MSITQPTHDAPIKSNGNAPSLVASIGIRLANIRSIAGWDLNHPYVETFWLPTIGPTSTLLLRYVGRNTQTSDYTQFDPSELSVRLGLGNGGTGWNGPVVKTIRRLTRFGLADIDSADRAPNMLVTVAPRVLEVPIALQSGWPAELRILHSRAIARQRIELAKARTS